MKAKFLISMFSERLLFIIVGWGFIPHRRWWHIKYCSTFPGVALFIELYDFLLPDAKVLDFKIV